MVGLGAPVPPPELIWFGRKSAPRSIRGRQAFVLPAARPLPVTGGGLASLAGYAAGERADAAWAPRPGVRLLPASWGGATAWSYPHRGRVRRPCARSAVLTLDPQPSGSRRDRQRPLGALGPWTSPPLPRASCPNSPPLFRAPFTPSRAPGTLRPHVARALSSAVRLAPGERVPGPPIQAVGTSWWRYGPRCWPS